MGTGSTCGSINFDQEALSAVFYSGLGQSGAFESGSGAHIRSLFPYLCHDLFFVVMIVIDRQYLQASLFDNLKEINV